MRVSKNVSSITYSVGLSCKHHPLLKHSSCPRTGQIRLNPQRLFAVGSLKLLDAKARPTYRDTEPLWQSLHAIHNVYLTFDQNGITTFAEGEHLEEVGEVVGIACGVVALRREIDINLNRFRQVEQQDAKKRLDFEFVKDGKRFFHEAKGTTYPSKGSSCEHDIVAKKNDTKCRCNEPGKGPAFSGATGSITVFRHVNRSHSCSISIVDPVPPERKTPPRQHDELSSVLRYYQSVYNVTHFRPRNIGLIGLSRWLSDVVGDLEAGQEPPSHAPQGLVAKGRISEPGVPGSDYKGTYFDARIAHASIERYASFDAASATLPSPVTFLGVSQRVTDLIVQCQWDDVLQFSDPNATELSDVNNGFDVTDSGVLTKSIRNDAEAENLARSMFDMDRARFLRGQVR